MDSVRALFVLLSVDSEPSTSLASTTNRRNERRFYRSSNSLFPYIPLSTISYSIHILKEDYVWQRLKNLDTLQAGPSRQKVSSRQTSGFPGGNPSSSDCNMYLLCLAQLCWVLFLWALTQTPPFSSPVSVRSSSLSLWAVAFPATLVRASHSLRSCLPLVLTQAKVSISTST